MRRYRFIAVLFFSLLLAGGNVWASSATMFTPGHIFLVDYTWHDSDIHEYDQNGNFIKSFKATLTGNMSGAGHIRWGKDGHLYTYGEYDPGTGWVARQQGVFEWDGSGTLLNYYPRDVTGIENAGRGFEVSGDGRFYVVETDDTVDLLREWERDFSSSTSFMTFADHKPNEAIVRYGDNLFITGNHDVAIFDTITFTQAGYFDTSEDNNHINVSKTGIIAVNQQWSPPEGTNAYVELYNIVGKPLGVAIMPNTGNQETQYVTKGMAFDDSERLYVTMAEWERSTSKEISYNVAVFNPDFTFEKLFLPANVLYKYGNIAISPSILPPSLSMENLTIRGKSYSAIGYSYLGILGEGQNFQNCVYDPGTGHLFTIDNNNNEQGFGIGKTDQVIEIDPSNGRVLKTINLPSDSLYSKVLTLGETGNLLFAERGGSPIFEIDKISGSVVSEFSIDSDTPPAPWPGIQRDGIAYNPNADTYYITEGNFSRVTRDTDGSFIVHESYNTANSGCIAPVGIAYESNNDTLLIIDDSSDRVYEFGLDGSFIAGEGTRTVEMPFDITQANGIAFDPLTGQIFITGVHSRTGDPEAAVLVVLTPNIPVTSGDLDGNGAVDKNDVYALRDLIGAPIAECPECDLNGDGRISLVDARLLVLSCTVPKCGVATCKGFEKPMSDLNATLKFDAVNTSLKFIYSPGLRHSTSVSFDLYLNDQLVDDNIGWIPPDGTSGEIVLPAGMVLIGDNIIELRNPVCPAGVGSCIDGQIISWAGTVCLYQ